MSLSIILEEPSGIRDDDLEYVGRVAHNSSRKPFPYGSRKGREHARYGSTQGRYNKAPAGRSGLGGLRFNQTFTPGGSMPMKFIRNPRHPKSMYDTEISMRNFIQGKPLKVTQDLSFPDPKSRKAMRNPLAPRFRHEFDLTEADYKIERNPLSGASVQMIGNSGFGSVYNQAFVADDNVTSNVDSGESDSSDDSSEDEDDVSVNDSASRVAEERARVTGTGSIYSSVQKYRIPKPPPNPPPPPAVLKLPPVLVFPRAVVHNDEFTPQRQEPQEVEEVPPPIPEPLHTLAEEDETQATEAEEEPQELRDMSTQTAIMIQPDVSQPQDQEAEEDDEDRFVQIQEESRGTMTHDNWEAVAPWSQSSAQVTRNPSLAVNYRRVVAELSGVESSEPAPEESTQEPSTQLRERREDPPPWSPPIVPQVEQRLRPMGREMHPMQGYPPTSRQVYPRNRPALFGFWNKCMFIFLMLMALVAIIGAAVVTALYVVQVSNCTTSCSLLTRPGHLAGFVAAGALAILVVLGLITWCCYNINLRRQFSDKLRPDGPSRADGARTDYSQGPMGGGNYRGPSSPSSYPLDH